MTTYTAKNAKRKPGRRRAAPVKPSPIISALAALLVLAGIWTDGGAALLLTVAGVTTAGVFLALHVRHVRWTEGVRRELDR